MEADIDITYFYNAYISNAKKDIKAYEEHIDTVKQAVAKVKDYLDSNKEKLRDWVGVNLDDYREYTELVYVKDEPLANKAFNKLKYHDDSSPERIMLFQVLRLAKLLLKIHKYQRLIELANKRSKLNKLQYRNYLERYYNYGISKCLLNGYAYKFGYGIGELMISRWRYYNASTGNKAIDYKATNEAKRKLIAEGKRPFKIEEKRAYDAAGVKYDGVEYRVMTERQYYYEIHIYNPKVVAHRHLMFKFSNRTDKKYYSNKDGSYKPCTFEQIAADMKSMEDVYNLKLGIYHKLSIANIYDPTLYINFVRNPSQEKWSRGTHVTIHRRRY